MSAAEPMLKEFQAFLADFPPGGDVKPLQGKLSSRLRKHAHPTLIAFWGQVGTGSFGEGFLVFFHPREYEQMLANWMMKDKPDPTRIPFARTAFGDLIYFRDLRYLDDDEEPPDTWMEASDVAFMSIHYSISEVITWSMDGFFAEDLRTFLHEDERAFYELYLKVAKKQPLQESQHCYFFEPALAIGGRAIPKHVRQGDRQAHQELLLQMTRE